MTSSTICVHGGQSHATDVAYPLTVSATYKNTSDKVYWRMKGSHDVRDSVESILAKLDAAEGSVMFSSGQAAAHSLLSVLKPTRISVGQGYHGTKQVIDLLGIEVVEQSSLRAGDVCWLETPNNPYCEITDIAAVKKTLAEGVIVCTDATFAPAPVQQPILQGSDYVVHSSTKFLNGHSDSVGGIVSCGNKDTLEKLYTFRVIAGNTPGSLDTWLLLRSLKTLKIRIEEQSRTATRLAAWLSSQSFVTKVWHPSLKGHPGHETALRTMSTFGGVLAFEVAAPEGGETFPSKLNIITAATSLGSVESLIEWRYRWDKSIPKTLLRLSVGLESFEDLSADLLRAGTLLMSEQKSKL